MRGTVDKHQGSAQERTGAVVQSDARPELDAHLGPVTISVRESTGRPVAPADPLTWLLGPGRQIDNPAQFLDQFCWLLVADGLSIWRVSVHLHILHPQLRGFAYRWWRERACIEEVIARHGVEQSPAFRESPLHPVVSSGAIVRRHLGGPSEPETALLRELREQGATDYLALPLTFSSGRHQAITFATDRPGGFDNDDIAHLLRLCPILALIFEVHATRVMTANLLATYVGRKAGAQVLGGRVRRGSGEHIQAVVLVADMRGFSALSDRLPSEQVLETLNQVFDLIVTRIHAEGGEVLKFLGDGLLAIFSVKTCGGESRATECAIEVANAIMAGLDDLNADRSGIGQDPVRLGIGLHLGPVFFGNVGAEDRLDFTALGPAVNLAFRLEALTKTLASSILVSGDFAAACPARMLPLGRHSLDHSGEMKAVFAPLQSGLEGPEAQSHE